MSHSAIKTVYGIKQPSATPKIGFKIYSLPRSKKQKKRNKVELRKGLERGIINQKPFLFLLLYSNFLLLQAEIINIF